MIAGMTAVEFPRVVLRNHFWIEQMAAVLEMMSASG
jgi:hypothetical protein